MADRVIRDAVRRHARSYVPRLLLARVVAHETATTEESVTVELHGMVADGEAVWRDPRMPHRIRATGAIKRARPAGGGQLWML